LEHFGLGVLVLLLLLPLVVPLAMLTLSHQPYC